MINQPFMKTSILLLLLALPVIGQVPGIPGLVPPRPGEPAEAPPVAAVPGLPDPDALATPRGQRFEHPNMDGQTAAFLYFQLTGTRVLVSSAAAQAEISLIQPGPLTNGQAADLLEKQLLMEGFALIPSGENEVKMVLSQGTATPGDQGAPVMGNAEELPEGDEFVTYVMALEFLKPDEALRAFQQVVGTFGPAGKVAAVPNASSVVISANTPLVRMLIELKNRIDVPSAQVGTKFVNVEFADVEELSERLNEIFNNQQQASQSARVQRTKPTPQIPGLQAAAGRGGSGGEDTPVNILPDVRTNRIFLMGRPVDLVFVEGLIEDFDSPSSKRTFLRRKLRYLPVAEFLSVAENALERTGASVSGGARSSSRAGQSSPRRSGATNTRTTGSNNRQNAGGGTQGGGGSRAAVSQQEVATAPESILVGKTLLVADNISNSIVVQGPPHHVEIIENLLDELDQPSEQIAITAVIGKYDVTNGRNFGVDLAQLFTEVTGDLSLAGQLRSGVPSVIDPTLLDNFTDLLAVPGAAGNGLSLYGLLGDDFAVFVNALETNQNFTAIARPTVFTTNNHEARISSGSRIAVPTSTFSSAGSINNASQQTNIEYRDIVLELVVLPLVNDKDEVTLNISLVRDNLGDNRIIQGAGIIPDIDTDEISTTVTVPNRSTIILGGLITEGEKDSQSGIPILSSIPIIGRVFGRTVTETKREELVILIHPSIIYSQAGLDSYQREFDTGSELAPKARASVEGGGVLPYKGAVQPVSDKGGQTYYPPQQPAPQAPERRPAVATSPSQRAMQKKMDNQRRR